MEIKTKTKLFLTCTACILVPLLYYPLLETSCKSGDWLCGIGITFIWMFFLIPLSLIFFLYALYCIYKAQPREKYEPILWGVLVLIGIAIISYPFWIPTFTDNSPDDATREAQEQQDKQGFQDDKNAKKSYQEKNKLLQKLYAKLSTEIVGIHTINVIVPAERIVVLENGKRYQLDDNTTKKPQLEPSIMKINTLASVGHKFRFTVFPFNVYRDYFGWSLWSQEEISDALDNKSERIYSIPVPQPIE